MSNKSRKRRKEQFRKAANREKSKPPAVGCTKNYLGHTGRGTVLWLLALAAAIKQYGGVSAFFQKHEGQRLSAGYFDITMGVLAAIPATFFYKASITNALEKEVGWLWETLWKKFSKGQEKEQNQDQDQDQDQETLLDDSAIQSESGTPSPFAGDPAESLGADYSVALAALEEALWVADENGESSESGKLRKVTNVVLGLCYGVGNFAIVNQSRPKEINHRGLIEVVLGALALANVSVGIDKSNQVTGDLAAFWYEKPVAGQFELLFQVLTLAEAKIKSLETEDERIALRASLKEKLKDKKTFEKVLWAVEAVLFEQERTAPCPKISVHHATGLFQKALSGLAKLATGCVAAAAVVPNVQGVASLLAGWGWTWPVGISLGVVASVSAFGLNKEDTDKWCKALGGLYQSEVSTEVKKSLFERFKDQLSAFWEGVKHPLSTMRLFFSNVSYSLVLGVLLASLQAIAQWHYTKVALEKIEFLKHLPESTRKFLENFSAVSGFSMVALTKGRPTGEGLQKISETCGCSDEVSKVDELYSKLIEGLIEKIFELAKQKAGRCDLLDWELKAKMDEVQADITKALKEANPRHAVLAAVLKIYQEDFNKAVADSEHTPLNPARHVQNNAEESSNPFRKFWDKCWRKKDEAAALPV